MLSKLVPVLGNVSEFNLGFDGDIADMMGKEVDIIINSAANTTFDERLIKFSIIRRILNKNLISIFTSKI